MSFSNQPRNVVKVSLVSVLEFKVPDHDAVKIRTFCLRLNALKADDKSQIALESKINRSLPLRCPAIQVTCGFIRR